MGICMARCRRGGVGGSMTGYAGMGTGRRRRVDGQGEGGPMATRL